MDSFSISDYNLKPDGYENFTTEVYSQIHYEIQYPDLDEDFFYMLGESVMFKVDIKTKQSIVFEEKGLCYAMANV